MTVDIATLAIRVESLEAQNATRELNRLTESGGRAEESIDGLAGASTKLHSILKMVAASAAAIKLYETIKEATLLASRYNELGIVMNVVGRNAGHTAAELSATEAALQKTGISALQSRDAITKLISANIDLSMATDLARLAQDAAVIGGMNSSEAFARLVKGIQSAEKETLETMGLNVNFQKSYEALGRTLNKNAKDLTTVEKTQAAVNAVMEKAPGIAGAYEASLTNAGKQMRSMERYIENLKVQLGQPFQSPFEDMIVGSTKALKFASENVTAIRSAIESLIAAVVPGMKIAAAYFAIFVAAPAILTAVAAAFTPLIHALALYAMNVAIGQTQTLYFNRTLFGVSVSAQLAAGSLTVLGLAIKSLFALFVGWEIGTYLNKQFLEVRVAGEVMAGALVEGWENIRYGAVMAWEAIKYSFTGTINAMKGAYATFLTEVGNGLRSIGATDTGNQIVAYAEGLRKAGEAQKDFRETTRGVTAEHERNLKVIETVTQSRIDKEVIAAKVVQATSAAEAAAVKPKKDLIELTDAQKKAYAAAVKSAKEYIESLQFEIAQIGLNASQVRMLTAAREAAKAPEAGQRMRIMQLALAREIASEAAESQAQAEKLANEAMDKSNDAVNDINAQTAALIFKVKTYGMLPEAITAVKIAELEASKQSLMLSEAGVNDIQRRIDALNQLAVAQAADTAQDRGLDVTKAKELLDILVAVDNATKSAADGMAESFGRVGAAIGGLTTALSGYAVQQQAIMAQLAAAKADPKNGPDKIAKLEIAAANASAQAKIKSYGDMASASKSFFKENTKGYKVMEGAEKAFRAYEMAMAVQAMVKKIFFKEGEVAANLALNGEKLTGEAATTAASTGLAATESSAWGITAVVKAIASLPFPMNIAAGAATLAAVVAIGAKMFGGVGGASSVPLSEQRQATQGTGTVLGDDTAKSMSIANSLEIMERNSELGLTYQSGMLEALRNIESALGGAAKGLLQTAGITGGSGFGTTASSDKSFFGASHTKDITDSGVKFSGSFGQLRAGQGVANQYEVIRTTSDGGMFRSGWERDDEKLKGLTAEARRPFTLIFDSMGEVLVEAGAALGQDSKILTDSINALPINFEASLRDLKGQDLTDALNAGLSQSFDKVTTALFPFIEDFRKMGEGLGETLVRVAADVQGVDSVFAAMGKSLITTTTNTVLSLEGWYGGWFNTVAKSVTTVGEMSLEAKERLVEASGGLEKFASQAASFMQNFYSDDERNAATKARLKPVLAQYGLSTEGSDAQKMFRQFVLGLDTSTKAGRETYAMLMDVQQAFTDVTSAAADERADLLDQIDELTMSEIQLLNKRRMALDASNRGLFDQVEATKAAKAAQDAAKTSLGDVISKMKSFGDSARSLSAGLVTGSLSTLTPEQQYAELERQYQTTRVAGIAGDAKAQANFASIAQSFLTASQKINGGDARYGADFAGVIRDSEEIAKWTTAQVDVAQASLDAMNAQVAGIATLNETMLLVAQGVGAIPSAIATPDYSSMGTSDKDALVAEIKLLNSKLDVQTKVIEGLRADQQKQTGDIITSNATVTADGAKTVVTGIGNANLSTRLSNFKVNLNAY
jgi:hypothetical protein